ncbi:MAG TPA: DegQ family serine endoprotease [Candidatus Aquilonibacter sp.]|nr:DegQ family serine endoprotease [Candidatus Aquilonibacter sp.]
MKLVTRSAVGFFSAAVGAFIVIAAVHFNLWGKDAKLTLNVDSTPVNRSAGVVTSYASIVKKAAPSVVNIYSTTIVHMRQRYWNPFYNDPFFQQFFGEQAPSGSHEITRKEESLGSGVIVSPDGYILTANHVVDGADEIKVALGDNDKKEYTAKVVGTDPDTDLAVLKIDATGLPAVTLGDSDQLEIGDVVLAIGNPFGVGQTVTHGIISALGRSGFDIDGGNMPNIQNFIQTDAPINPGNSGGALVDAEGRLIGINTWIASNSGGSEGVGFAVPVNLARRVMERLIGGSKLIHGYLGITLQDVNVDLAQEFDLPNQNGAIVDDVLPGTPAAKAGLQSGDVIVAFNDQPIADAHSLQLAVSSCSPGASAKLKIIRNGREQTMSIVLGDLSEQNSVSSSQNGSNGNISTNDSLNGVTVTDLDQDARQQLQIPDDIEGALVTEVDPDSNAAEAGLQEDDVIMEINRQPVTDADDAVTLCNDAKGDHILLKIWRRSGDFVGTQFLSVDNTVNK